MRLLQQGDSHGYGFILVVNAPQNMVAYGTETFDAKELALAMLLGATCWRWLGYV